jgi:CDP-4-dehydro-6-deoxyglucose reductase
MTDQNAAAPGEGADIENRTATVTVAEAMDHNRNAELASAVDADRERIHERLSLDDQLPEFSAGDVWDEVVAELSAQGETTLSDRIGALLQRVERPYPSLVRLAFDVHDTDEEPFEFTPGQYVRIGYEDEEPRVYSVASSPNEDAVELCIRRVPGGELTPVLCDEVTVGDELFVRGPYGDELELGEPADTDPVFVATGTGVAPLRSMIRYLFEEGHDVHDGTERDVWLFLGAAWEDHLPYREEFRELAAEHENFHPVFTLSRESYLTDWDGETEYVQHSLLKYLDPERVEDGGLPEEYASFVGTETHAGVGARLDPERMELYVCGIGAMCDSVRSVAEALGVDERRYEEESYG